jgi:hypothetical protein
VSGIFNLPVIYALIKAVLSGLIVAAVSEAAKRNPAFGALIASLPLVSILGMIWLWRDTGDAERIAAHAEATFWFVLPSLPMFLVMPALLRAGFGFWSTIGMGVVVTVALYLLTAWILAKAGIFI